MSIREINAKWEPLSEVEYPEFKTSATLLNKWERFKRNFDVKYRPSLSYALIVNSLFLVTILVFTWVSVAFEGFINPSTMLRLFSLPILLAAYDFARLIEQEEEKAMVEEKALN